MKIKPMHEAKKVMCSPITLGESSKGRKKREKNEEVKKENTPKVVEAVRKITKMKSPLGYMSLENIVLKGKFHRRQENERMK